MKSSIKKMSALLTMMAVAILTFTFTACSDDDDPVTEVTYTYGFSSMSASHPDFLEEMGKIENAFQSALGITGKLFTKKGTIEECDKQVYESIRFAQKRGLARGLHLPGYERRNRQGGMHGYILCRQRKLYIVLLA